MKSSNFVTYVIKRIQEDSGYCAAFKKADNPDLEYMAWEHLSSWCDLEKNRDRKIYATVGASLARAKPEIDGDLNLGKALISCYGKDNQDPPPPALARFRRLLSCSSSEEACSVLRPILKLIASKEIKISYARLLDDLIYFGDKTKLKWANDFYFKMEEN